MLPSWSDLELGLSVRTGVRQCVSTSHLYGIDSESVL